MVKSYKDLDVWKKSIDFVKKVYQATRDFPKEALYGLTGQIRKSALSIPSNIAEGRSRQHSNEFIQFLYIASGSCAECETPIMIDFELKYIQERNEKELLEELGQIGKMIRGLMRGLR